MRRTAGLRARVAAIALAAVPAAVLLAPPGASAHARLVESEPRAFSVVAESPETITLRFDEAVESGLATMEIYDADQRLVQSPTLGEADWFAYGGELVATPDALPTGTYVVVWRVTSADGHPVQGAFPFTVGDGADTDQQELLEAVLAGVESTGSIGTALAAARLVGYLGIVAMIGVLVAASPSALIGDPRVSRLWRFGAAATVTGAVAVAMLHGADAVRGGWADVVDANLLSETLGTRLGASLAVRVAAVGLLVALVASRRRRAADAPSAPWANAAAIGAVIAVGTWAASGHGASADPVPVAMALHGSHMLAVAAWVGGLTTLLVAGERASAPVVSAFSRRASVAVPVAVVSGAALEWILVDDISAIGDNAHSRALIVKVALVAVVLVFAAAARAAFRAARPAGVRRAMMAEAAVALAVLGATAVMVDFDPREQSRREAAMLNLAAGGAMATVEVGSPETGPSEVHVYLTPPGGSLERATSITGRLTIPDGVGGASSQDVPVDFVVSGANHWTAFVDFPYPGDWTIRFSVTLPGPSTVSFSGSFDVAG